MASIDHRLPLCAEDEWDGVERRSEIRQRYELGREYEAPQTVKDAIIQRIRKAVTEGDSATFSSSSHVVLRDEGATILQYGTSCTMHETTSDPYGKSIYGSDQDGVWHTDSWVGNKGRYVLQKLPIKVIPHLPIDPEIIEEKAQDGTLEFKYAPTKTMGLIVWSEEDGWSDIFYCPAGDIATPPTARRYGEEMFGGIVAFRLPSGEIVILRPDFHVSRFFRNAKRMCMADFRDKGRSSVGHQRKFTEPDMVEMMKHVIRANSDYMPTQETGGRLYLSPVAFAGGPHLSVAQNEKIVIATEAFPVGKYFSQPLHLKIETQYHRAGPGMMGDVKAGGGYVTCFEPEERAKEEGFDKCLYLDPSNERVLELNAANIFFIIDDEILTPNLSGEILEGVTRDTILQMCKRDPAIQHAFKKVHDKNPVLMSEILAAFQSEGKSRVKAFVTGTAATIHRIESFGYCGMTLECEKPKVGESDSINLLADRFKELVDGKLENDQDSEVRALYEGMLVRI